MSLWRQLSHGLRALANRRDTDGEIADEVAHWFDQAVAAGLARGLSPEAARRGARLEVGSRTAVHEEVRGYGWENLVETTLADIRHAARQLRRAPGFALVSVLTLAIGLGASTAIFSAVKPVLFDRLPYPHGERIVSISDRSRDGGRVDVTFGTFREIGERSRTLATVAVMKPWQPAVTGAATPERVDGQRVSSAYLATLGVAPALGRDFTAEDDEAGRTPVAVIGDGFWRRHFGANPGVIGRTVALDDVSYTVIGVMPRGFENVLAASAEVWAPLGYDRALPPGGREWGHHLSMIGRLAPGASVASAARELEAIARTPVTEFPRVQWARLELGLNVHSLRDDVSGNARPVLVALLGAVLLLLAIACVNVTNLLVARGAQRQGELAMRAALGAGRGRLVRQLLTESLLLSLIGGVFGMVVAVFGVRALVSLSPPGLPRIAAVRLDGGVFVVALAATSIIGIAVGLLPALRVSRAGQHGALQRQSHRTTGGQRVTRRALVVGEVALALVLLVGAGLLLRSVHRLFAIAPGFEPAHRLTMQVQAARGSSDTVNQRFFDQALEAVRRIPGVTAAAFTSQLPLGGEADKYGVSFESVPSDPDEEDGSAFRYTVTPGYIETMGIPLRAGRVLDTRDRAGAPVSVLINESFARRKFPGRSAVGERLHFGDVSQPWYTIVGVVGDVKQTSLALANPDAVYITADQWYFSDPLRTLVIRARGDAAALTPEVTRAIRSVDRDRPIIRVATMERLVSASVAEQRFALMIFGAFAIAALALAAAGIYGVMSGSVTERTREIGVRSALGASRGEIVGLVMRQGMSLCAMGAVIGLVGAFASSGALGSLLFGVSRLDAVTHVSVVAALLGVSAVACWVPAWRAARVDPAITLRGE